MILLYILLIATGALPMVVFLIKRKNYRHILSEGNKTMAQITEVRTLHYQKGGAYDRVHFAYLPFGAGQYLQGKFIAKIGKHKRGEKLEVYYLSSNPKKHAVPGSKGELFMFIFMLLLFLFVIYATFKIHEMVKGDNVTYTFRPPWKK